MPQEQKRHRLLFKEVSPKCCRAREARINDALISRSIRAQIEFVNTVWAKAWCIRTWNTLYNNSTSCTLKRTGKKWEKKGKSRWSQRLNENREQTLMVKALNSWHLNLPDQPDYPHSSLTKPSCPGGCFPLHFLVLAEFIISLLQCFFTKVPSETDVWHVIKTSVKLPVCLAWIPDSGFWINRHSCW